MGFHVIIARSVWLDFMNFIFIADVEFFGPLVTLSEQTAAERWAQLPAAPLHVTLGSVEAGTSVAPSFGAGVLIKSRVPSYF